jgi:hypothetical protein
MIRSLFVILVLFALSAICGCATIRVTDPYSTATQEFLESEATRKAVAQMSSTAMRDRRVYVDASYLTGAKQTSPGNLVATKPPSPEDLFLLGEIRSRLLNDGVRLIDDRDAADIILEVRSGGISVDHEEFLLGLPGTSLTVDVVANVPVSTPELAIVKRTTQKGFASVAYVAYWRESGEIVASSGPYVGRTNRQDYWILGLGPNTVGDIAPALPPPPSSQPSK